jgi:hypothetical protein
MHFESTYCGYDDCTIGDEATVSAFDVEEFFCSDVSSESWNFENSW